MNGDRIKYLHKDVFNVNDSYSDVQDIDMFGRVMVHLQ